MFKKLSLALATVLLFTGLITSTALAEKKPKTIIEYAPAEESLINGVPESELISPMWVSEPEFLGYSAGSPSTITFFKLIASSYVDNRSNPNPFHLVLNITQSTAKGSEWSGSVKFNASIKTGILGEVGLQVSGGVKETREVNEAVGISGSTDIPPYKQGQIEAYYPGISSSGNLTYRIYDSCSDTGYIDYTKPITAKVHKEALEVNFKPIVW